jgi:hypothetical protein
MENEDEDEDEEDEKRAKKAVFQVISGYYGLFQANSEGGGCEAGEYVGQWVSEIR